MLALAENPAMVSPGAESLTELQGQWWVAHTRSRCEKAFAWDLVGRGVGYFLPMVRKTTYSGGKKRNVMKPLFPSYVFFCGDGDSRYAALRTNRLARVMEVKDQARLVSELANIERVLKNGAQLELYPFAAVGQRCRICSGPFADIEGVIVRRDRPSRIVLNLSFLGQGAEMTIDVAMLAPVV